MKPRTPEETGTSDERTPAQLYCGVFGILLLAMGALGFLVNGSFEGASAAVDVQEGQAVAGDELLGFEVNGWHNVVHLASGAALLGAAFKRAAAAVGAFAFGVTYLIVTAIGFMDGNDVFGIIPVNTADNVLHAAIALLGLLAVSAPARAGTAYRPREGKAHAAPPSRRPLR